MGRTMFKMEKNRRRTKKKRQSTHKRTRIGKTQTHGPDHSDVVYCIFNKTYTYVGVTNNMQRRLRQHNGELRGGARYTTNIRKATGELWALAFLVTGFPSRRDALQLEWRLHGRVSVPSSNPFGKSTASRRAIQLQRALQMERVTKSATPNDQLELRIFWRSFEHYMTAIDKVTWPVNVSHRSTTPQ